MTLLNFGLLLSSHIWKNRTLLSKILFKILFKVLFKILFKVLFKILFKILFNQRISFNYQKIARRVVILLDPDNVSFVFKTI